MRLAELELAGDYNPAEHDEFFTYFDWKQFSDEEWRLCPPVLSVGGDGAMYDIGFQNLSRLMASGKPLRVVVVDTQANSAGGGQSCGAGFRGQVAEALDEEPGQRPKEEGRKELALIAMAHRGTFVMQSSQATPSHLFEGLLKGLQLRRPPSDSSFRYFFHQVDVAALCAAIRDWTIAQIPGGADDLDQLIDETIPASIRQAEPLERRRANCHVAGAPVGVVVQPAQRRRAKLAKLGVLERRRRAVRRRPREHVARHRNVGIVFQSYALFPNLTARENITLLAGLEGWETGDIEARFAELLALCHLDSSLAERYPHELSGGQLQRVVIARALVLHPKLIIADEPVSMLDASEQAKLITLLKAIQNERGMGLLLISHDLALVRKVADRILVMREGRQMDIIDAADATQESVLTLAMGQAMKPATSSSSVSPSP